MEGAPGGETVLSGLESAIETIVKYYKRYASQESLAGRKEGIKKSNFKKMLQSELSHILTDTQKKEAVRKLFQELDQNRDGVIGFDEYWDLIGSIANPIARAMQ